LLYLVRLIIFVIVWLLTFGKHNFWILPNLTEDVGFFESFWPLYNYEYKGDAKQEKEDSDDKDKTENENNHEDNSSSSDELNQEVKCETKAVNGSNDNEFEILNSEDVLEMSEKT